MAAAMSRKKTAVSRMDCHRIVRGLPVNPMHMPSTIAFQVRAKAVRTIKGWLTQSINSAFSILNRLHEGKLASSVVNQRGRLNAGIDRKQKKRKPQSTTNAATFILGMTRSPVRTGRVAMNGWRAGSRRQKSGF